MPLIRDYTHSNKVDRLTPQAEVLFVRILLKADCNGNFTGSPRLIINNCFPLRENIRTADVERWLNELSSEFVDETSGEVTALIRMYTVNSKTYLHVFGYGQKLKFGKPKFPPPPEVEVEENPEIEVEDESERETAPEYPSATIANNIFKIEKKKSIDELAACLKNDQYWIEIACMKESKTKEEILARVDVFAIHCKSIGTLENTESDFKKHFFNWSAKQSTAVKNGKTVSGGFPDYYDAKLESQLKGKDLSNYWKHLNEKGWRPLKKKINGVEQVVEWIKQAAA